MNEQIKTLTQAYMEELDNIENACFTERKEMLQQQKDKWYVMVISAMYVFDSSGL